MRKVFLAVLITAFLSDGFAQTGYVANRLPLHPQPYSQLPLGSIRARGWLLKMLELQRDGLTGHLDSLYPEVCGSSNAWLGGTGDAWERGPYWLDGLVPLAYLLDDKNLMAKTRQWIEWSISHQRPDGYFGPQPPAKRLPAIPGIQNTDHEDWWPKMVMLKVLQQYYSATEDKRVLKLMSNYFRYMLRQLPEKPLGHWSFWGAQRGGDNLAVVYWLYNITGEEFLLRLGDLIYEQTTPWKSILTDGTLASVNPYPRLHCVNVAQGLKTPAVYFERTGDSSYLQAIKQGLQTLRNVHGFANGMYGGDERLHGNSPTQGSEFCSAVEMMFSFESILPITGDSYYGDYLEKIAFNVLPTQHNDDYTLKQYFQQPNQIKITYDRRNFFNDGNGRLVYGLLTGYPCCTCNMHQGYPKYVQNLWYSTADGGVAALVYGASEATVTIRSGDEVHFSEETAYPFDTTIRFTYLTDKTASFPLHLRIPNWCQGATVIVNGKIYAKPESGEIVRIERVWKKRDSVELVLPMEVRASRWDENAIAIERGPLLYALRVEEDWQQKKNDDFPQAFYEVFPKSAWNYGITADAIAKMKFTIRRNKNIATMPWNLDNAPISITTEGKLLRDWKEYNNSAGPLPSHAHSDAKPAVITLVPYGCTTLRISEFPVTD